LANVRQIGIEFHKVTINVKIYFKIVQQLYKLGYKTIAWDPNLTTHPIRGPFAYYEIVFRKTNLDICSQR
jgi:hypothetical protein